MHHVQLEAQNNPQPIVELAREIPEGDSAASVAPSVMLYALGVSWLKTWNVLGGECEARVPDLSECSGR